MYTSQEIMDIYEAWQQHYRAEGVRELVMYQLIRRFGDVPPEIAARIQEASMDALTLWAERLATAQSIEDIVHEEREPVDTLQQVQTTYEEWQRHRAAGARDGMARLLTSLLARRFGEVPPEIAARVREASMDTLERWAERVLTAQSIDDVLA